MSDTRNLHVRKIPDPLLRRIRVAAAKLGLTMREVVVEALEQWLERGNHE